MSFVPAPQQANAAVNAVVPVAPAAMAAPAATETSDADLLFKIRTFDVYWVEKYALMYKDGIAKV
jgi:ATP-dependent RNA helicase DDX60